MISGRTAIAILLALALGSAAAAQEPEPARDSPAVMLRAPLPRTPIETAGTGLAPAVGVRVAVDERGTVTRVEITSLRPSSAYDDLVAETVRRTVARWRFAPARRGGAPVASTFEWTVELPPLEKAPPPSPAGDLATLLDDFGQADEFDRLRRIYGLPVDQQRRHLERLVAIADRHVARPTRHEAESRWFRVVTDIDQAEAANILLANLEATYGTLVGLLAEDVRPQGAYFRVQAYVFRTRQEYLEFRADVACVPEWSAGVYSPPGLIAFHAEVPGGEVLRSVLIHEATHAFVDRHLVRPGTVLPRWLGEGFAEYMGNSEIKKGKLVPGGFRKLQFYFGADDVYVGKTGTALGVDEVKRLVRRRSALTVADLLDADREMFYGGSHELFYLQSWMLVHFLRHGRPSWGEREFPAMLLYAAEGYDAVDALRAAYDLAPAELEDAYREYVRKF